MSEPPETTRVDSEKKWWLTEAWEGARPRVMAVATEGITSAAIMSLLALFYFVLRLLFAVGVPEETLKPFLHLEHWLMLSVFATFGFNFLLEAVDGVVVKIKELKTRAETSEAKET